MTLTVETHCAACDVRATWSVEHVAPDLHHWTGDTSFPCEHWRDHHEAGSYAVIGDDAGCGHVTARIKS